MGKPRVATRHETNAIHAQCASGEAGGNVDVAGRGVYLLALQVLGVVSVRAMIKAFRARI